MTEKRKITCIVCPLGCRMEITMDGKNIVSIEGNACPRGKVYARQEVIAPSRIVMSVVKCRNCPVPVISVKTEKPVPKEFIGEIMQVLRDVEVEPPVKVGDIIVENVLGLGVDVVATRSAGKSSHT